MTTVYIVEREQIARSGLEMALRQSPELEISGVFEDGSSCLEAVARQAPDVIVSGLDLKDMPGTELIRSIKELSPESRVVVFTSYADDVSLFNSFSAGADAFVPKGSTINLLLRAIECVASGAVWLDPIIAKRALKIATEMAEKPLPEMPVGKTISNRETEVLGFIMDGFTNGRIASQLYLSEDTVKSHVRNLLSKLEVKTRTQAATKAVELGLVSERIPVPALGSLIFQDKLSRYASELK